MTQQDVTRLTTQGYSNMLFHNCYIKSYAISRFVDHLNTGFVHFHNLRNPGFSRTYFALFPGVFQGYLKYTKQFPREVSF